MEHDDQSPPSHGKNNFTQIQSRKFRRATHFPCWSLCPSMDLVALGTNTRSDIDADSQSQGGGILLGEQEGSDHGAIVAESIAVHRILSWQSLLMLKAEQLTSSRDISDGDTIGGGVNGICVEDIERECAELDGDKTMSVDPPPETKGATSVCWSPDGRYLAVGLVDGGVLIHTVEPDAGAAEAAGGDVDGHGALHLIRPPPPAPAPSSPRAESSLSPSGKSNQPSFKNNQQVAFSPRVTRSMVAAGREREAVKERSVAPKTSPRGRREKGVDPHPLAVVGMTWNRLSPRHLSQIVGNGEREIRESWRHSSQLIDRGSHFLPMNTQTKTCASEGNGLNLFSSMAHLNVLCVATTEEIHWYLQGQYRILSIPHGLDGCSAGVDLACSPDLSTLLAVTKQTAAPSSPKKTRPSPMKAKLYGTPLLPQKRFDLQILSASYRSIFSHLWDARKGIQASLVSWKSALRPLDTKFQGLLQLLSKYQLGSTVGDGGGDSSGGSNSIRLEFLRFILSGRSTVAGNASSALDQFFTRPQMHDQFLQREARGVEASVASMEGVLRSQVLGSIRAVVYEAEELYGMARSRKGDGAELIDAETALLLYTSSRMLFLTFDKCLGYVVEARSRLHDLLGWIRGTASQVRAWGTATDSIQRQNARSRRISNGVVQRVASFLSRPMVFTLKDDMDDHRVLTECVIGVPLSDFFGAGNLQQPRMADCDKENAARRGTKCIRSLKSTVQSIFQICTILFDKPRTVFAQSLNTLDICFEVEHSLMAIHTRIGAGPDATSGGKRGDTSGFFVPRTNEKDPSIEECPFWTLLARSLGTSIELIAIPGCTSFERDTNTEFYLRANLMIPEGSEVTNIVFYGDDGISSLSPDLNNDFEIKEGRQSLGLVMQCIGSVSSEIREELLVVRYDDMIFRKFDFKRNSDDEVTVSATELNKDECTFLAMLDDENDDASSMIVPKRRHISTHRGNSQIQRQPQVNLCGSRGTGGVITFGALTSLNIFDLEEDEDTASSEEGDDECSEEDGSTN